MEKGLVSVIMPCFNDGAYIEQSIASVHGQTYQNYEIIVIDDGSDDGATKAILDGLRNTPKCRVLTTEHVGASMARNHGISQAEGQYILPLDADDTIDSTYLAKAVEAIESRPETGIVYCYADKFGCEKGRWELPDYSLDQMLRDNIIFITALFYKQDWEAVGGFNPDMRYGMEDYDFWIGILELGREVCQIPEVLFHYRVKKKSRTTSFLENMDNVKQMYAQIYDHHPKFYVRYQEQYAKALRDALIEQIFARRALVRASLVNRILTRFPKLRQLIKKLIIKS